MTNKDLISQYVDTGLGIPRYQFDKLSNNDKKTYLRKIEISIGEKPPNLRYYYGELPEDKLLAMVKKDSGVLGWMINPSYIVQMMAVKDNGNVIGYVKNPPEELQMIAVKQDAYSIISIENPTEKVQMEAILENPNMIRHIKNPTENVQLRVIRENPYAIEYIETPTENTQLEAIKNTNGRVIKYIKNLTDKAIELSKRYNL